MALPTLAKKCILSELWPFELAIIDLSHPLEDVSLEHLILQMAVAMMNCNFDPMIDTNDKFDLNNCKNYVKLWTY